jgi:hypothetical protein
MASDAGAAPAKESMTPTLAPDKVKLLLVDDDRDNLLALQAVLIRSAKTFCWRNRAPMRSVSA